MENEVYIVGEYVSGISKRPDLVGQPCVLVYKEEGITLSVLVNEQAESFEFPYSSIDNITSNTRLLVSENTDLDRQDPKTYENLIAFAFLGLKGFTITKTAELSNRAFRNTIGKIDYSSRHELIVEYHLNDENRRLLINANNNPREFIEYFNNIKR